MPTAVIASCVSTNDCVHCKKTDHCCSQSRQEKSFLHHRSAFFYPHKILFEIHRVFGFFCFRILIFTDFIQSPIIFFWQRDLANPRPATDFPSPAP
jgi:hypothetical protein